MIRSEMIAHLPVPVRNWLTNLGLIGTEKTYAVRLKQHAKMKMKPDQDKWSEAFAEQYYTISQPAFLWKVDMQMMPFLDVVGRDRFIDGKGGMLIKLLALIPVVNVKDNEKINSAAMQRYLAEIVWFPAAALNPFITWEEIDNRSAKAIMTYKGTRGSGIFYFNEQGEFLKFKALRYFGGEDDATLKEWIITATESSVMHGIRIPVQCEATWKLPTGDWTWLKLKITDIEYNNTNKF